jgi:SAM-dependent methyltransferase
MPDYSKDFYLKREVGSERSAEIVVPLVLSLLQPSSVIDVGCGTGTWLSVFRRHGIQDVLGVDGEYVDKTMLKIPLEHFMSFDLTQPLHLNRKFDLVVSVEVAEHLSVEYAQRLVDSLTQLGPAVLFSAAVPFQGGVGHLNEQWPQYWAKYFQERQYQVIDCFRKSLWSNENVQWWYAQNLLLFVQETFLSKYSLPANPAPPDFSQLSVIHPRHYLIKNDSIEHYRGLADEYADMLKPENMSLKQTLLLLPFLMRRATAKRIRKVFEIFG